MVAAKATSLPVRRYGLTQLRRCSGTTTAVGKAGETDSGDDVVAERLWKFDIEVRERALHVEYPLPRELKTSANEVLDEFFDPLVAQVRGASGGLLAGSCVHSLRNRARTLQFLHDVRHCSLQLVEKDRPMEAFVLATTHWRAVASAVVEPAAGSEGATPEKAVAGTEDAADTAAAVVATKPACLHLSICAQRTTRDRAPAIAAVVAGIFGPLAWVPGVLIVNEILMRRVQKYGMLNKNFSFSQDGISLIKSTVRHHIGRMVMDYPRIVDLDEAYKIEEEVTAEALKTAIEDGSFGDLIEGRLEL
eukprot:TRINITY_DN75108_c0_g1_i2.p1 TRINITY_DN75108_c0_g1~~TRINITY_DN75108_c0_g1_i2.p1  ORF type:complete len:316 (+),score=74.07 TRINITY_DN75108_c0_g1_i2:34-948(+)